ncbi:MAG: DUF3683 domain-containing protein, partial [Magnetococcus sp. WYHC-3]
MVPSAAPTRIREIPYNYTSFSDREIVIRLLGTEIWEILERLRSQRVTGRSARMLLEVLGAMWMVTRNPLVQDSLVGQDGRRLGELVSTMRQRLDEVQDRANDNLEVLTLVLAARNAVADFSRELGAQNQRRNALARALKGITAPGNLDFSGIARVSHATDATDWRVAFPFAVIAPDHEAEVAGIVRVCIQQGFTLIPRGGGTCYTASGVPLYPDSVLINTEKLNDVGTVQFQPADSDNPDLHVIACGAGAITRSVTDAAYAAGFVFAVDPTSQNASTIGGNIAMNAGGKKAVQWGTTLDNLLSWRMVTPDADWLEVTRLQHNQGKIHDVPLSHFRVQRYAADGRTPVGAPRQITLQAEEIRRPGLGKDVTNKFLGGLPGVQKEGCDGLVTSARFVVHRQPAHTHTLALEFYDQDLRRSVPAIVEIKRYLEQNPQVG